MPPLAPSTQCAAVSTHLGAMTLPVQCGRSLNIRNFTHTAKGNSFFPITLPPTIFGTVGWAAETSAEKSRKAIDKHVDFIRITLRKGAACYEHYNRITVFNRDLRFGHPATVRVLQSAARVQDIRSPLTIDAPFAPVSVAECRSIAVFQLAGGLFADTAPSSSLFSNPAALVRRSPSPVNRLAQAAPVASRRQYEHRPRVPIIRP